MKLPSLKVTLPLLFLLWCIVGVWIHGLVILAYPMMWLVVGLVFLGMHYYLTKASASRTTSTQQAPISSEKAPEPAKSESSTREMSASV